MGWDGDALAEQMEEALERQQAAAEARLNRPTPSAVERAHNAALESLRLSKARILDQLSRATNPAHRKMLESALQSIEAKFGNKD